MLQIKALYQGQPTAAVATVYTVPTSSKAVVTEVLVANTYATPVNFTLHKVPNAGTPTVATMIVPNVQIPPNTLVTFAFGTVMDTVGDTLRLLASVAAALTVTISGYEEAP